MSGTSGSGRGYIAHLWLVFMLGAHVQDRIMNCALSENVRDT